MRQAARESAKQAANSARINRQADAERIPMRCPRCARSGQQSVGLCAPCGLLLMQSDSVQFWDAIKQPASCVGIPQNIKVPAHWSLAPWPKPLALISLAKAQRSNVGFCIGATLVCLPFALCGFASGLGFVIFMGLCFIALPVAGIINYSQQAKMNESYIQRHVDEATAMERLLAARNSQEFVEKQRAIQNKIKEEAEAQELRRDKEKKRILLDRQMAADASQHIKSGSVEIVQSPAVLQVGEQCYFTSSAFLTFNNRPYDSGHVAITNKRLVFVSKTTNIAIDWKRMLSFKMTGDDNVTFAVNGKIGLHVLAMPFPLTFVSYSLFAFKEAGLIPPSTLR